MYFSISKNLVWNLIICNHYESVSIMQPVYIVCRSSLAGKKKKADGKNKSKKKKEDDTTNSGLVLSH